MCFNICVLASLSRSKSID